MKKKDQFIRKLIHVFTGLAILWLTYLLDYKTLLYLIIGGSLFAFLTFPFRYFSVIHSHEKNSYGTLFYPVGILSSYILLSDQHPDLFRTALLVLTLSDTFANFAGRRWRFNYFFALSNERKSWVGVLAYLISTAIIYFIFVRAHLNGGAYLFILFLFVSVHFEVISWRGSDNLTIPLGVTLFLNGYDFFTPGVMVLLLIVMPLLGVGCFFLYKWRMLTRKAALFAYLLGVYLMGFAGWKWMVAVLFFFITSVLFTRWHDRRRKIRKDHAPRNTWQVVANIAPAVVSSLFFLFSGNAIWVLVFAGLIAAVTADTWASEIGPVFNSRCLSLQNMNWESAGVSGGVSFAGTLAAFTGAGLSSVLILWMFFGELQWSVVLWVTMAGFLASVVDSLLGAFLEPRLLQMNYFKNVNPGEEKITPNDIVNFGASLFAALLIMVLFWTDY